jgi:dTDP-glucose 4,6-dehydratase
MSKQCSLNHNYDKIILITGGAGFIGSHLIEYLLNKYINYYIINIDSLTYASDIKRLDNIKANLNYKFIQGNICDQVLLDSLFQKYMISHIIHLAAESHVDNSIIDPSIFIKTNINGTFTLLEAARHHWLSKNEQNRFLHISTDEVYGSLGEYGFFSEKSPYAPSSPYSASKASSDLLVKSFFHTYNLPIIISNCSNNYGPKQHDEKFIPTIIRKALFNEEIPIYGNGKNIRDWLYVKDHCSALDIIFHKAIVGESYNIGVNNEQSNITIANLVCDILNELKPLSNNKSYNQQISYVTDRLGHDYRYAIDNRKLCSELHWNSTTPFINSLQATIAWYIHYYEKNEYIA